MATAKRTALADREENFLRLLYKKLDLLGGAITCLNGESPFTKHI